MSPHRTPPAAASNLSRETTVFSDLDGALDQSMLEAMQGVWSTLEQAAVTGESHARAVRARLFWETLQPGGAAAAPSSVVADLWAASGDPSLADAA